MQKIIRIGKIRCGNELPFVLIAGPCVIESRDMVMKTAAAIKKVAERVGVPFIFKASYDKANRSSIASFRGIGKEEGLSVLAEVKETLDVAVLSDVHSPEEAPRAARVLDVLQIPAFLCRQTDLLLAAAGAGKTVNVKKGQFLAPWDVKEIIKKIRSQGNDKIMLTERGTSFGYNNLVTDFRSLEIMREEGFPVVFDASHSVQQPGGLGTASGGQSEFIPLLSRCAVAAGCGAVFLEVHPSPARALSDGPNMLPLTKLEALLRELKSLDNIVKKKKRTRGRRL